MSEIQKFKLSEKYTVYKVKFENKFTKDDLIKRVEQNRLLQYKSNIKNNHSITLNIECDEFHTIDDFFVNKLKEITGKKGERISKFSWVYTQDKEFAADWMHNHKNLHRFNKSKLETEWVCVYYIQIPNDMKDGNLIFKTETGEFHTFVPEESYVMIFSGEIDHMTSPSQESSIKRISYVSNFNFID